MEPTNQNIPRPAILRLVDAARTLWNDIWRDGVVGILALLWTALIALHIFFKDRMDRLAVIFYATPWILLAVAGWGLVGIQILGFRKRGGSWSPGMLAMAAAAVTGIAVAEGFHFGSPVVGPVEGPRARLAAWNLGRPKESMGSVVRKLLDGDADFAGLFETGVRDRLEAPDWVAEFLPLAARPLANDVASVSKHPVELIECGVLGRRGGRYAVVRTELAGVRSFVVLADVTSDRTEPRRVSIERLAAVVESYAQQPLILMGDFNTPSESTYFRLFRPTVRNAFHEAGRGWSATWPSWFPVLDLDQIWVSAHWRVVKARLMSGGGSDHRRVEVEIAPAI